MMEDGSRRRNLIIQVVVARSSLIHSGFNYVNQVKGKKNLATRTCRAISEISHDDSSPFSPIWIQYNIYHISISSRLDRVKLSRHDGA
jgi:hypothetical protein